jgi:hypothetical protein
MPSSTKWMIWTIWPTGVNAIVKNRERMLNCPTKTSQNCHFPYVLITLVAATCQKASNIQVQSTMLQAYAS